MAANQSSTYADALRKTLSQLAVAGSLPDADLQFNSQIQMVITGFLKQQAGAVGGQPPPQGQGQPPQTPSPDQTGPPGGGIPPGMGQSGPGLSAAMNPGPPQAAPNADELRRVLSGAGGQ